MAALLILFTPNVLYAVLGLLCVLLGMAAIYFLQGAAFIAVAYVVVYGSSVLVLILFSTFLFPHDPLSMPNQYLKWLPKGLVVGLVGGCITPLVRFTIRALQQQGTVYPLKESTVAELGLQLLGPYALAFEWAGFSLLITLVGTAYIMKEA